MINDSYKMFDNTNQFYEWLHKNYSDELLQLTNTDNRNSNEWNKYPVTIAIDMYRSDMGMKINKCLRENKPFQYENYIKQLNGFLRQNLIPDNIVVYRFVSDKELKDIKLNMRQFGLYKKMGFLSTTIFRDIYARYQHRSVKDKTSIKIYVPKGTCGIFLDNHAENSHDEEFEFLFPLNTKLLEYEGRNTFKIISELN